MGPRPVHKRMGLRGGASVRGCAEGSAPAARGRRRRSALRNRDDPATASREQARFPLRVLRAPRRRTRAAPNGGDRRRRSERGKSGGSRSTIPRCFADRATCAGGRRPPRLETPNSSQRARAHRGATRPKTGAFFPGARPFRVDGDPPPLRATCSTCRHAIASRYSNP